MRTVSKTPLVFDIVGGRWGRGGGKEEEEKGGMEREGKGSS